MYLTCPLDGGDISNHPYTIKLKGLGRGSLTQRAQRVDRIECVYGHPMIDVRTVEKDYPEAAVPRNGRH